MILSPLKCRRYNLHQIRFYNFSVLKWGPWSRIEVAQAQRQMEYLRGE
jgi:hypothetical protein